MNIEFISTSPKPICEGCLSLDLERKLAPIHDSEIERYFEQLIESAPRYSDVDHKYQPRLLCWECTAIIKRALKFKRQVQKAQSHLVLYRLRYITPATLSDLSTHIIPSENVLCDTSDIYDFDQVQPKFKSVTYQAVTTSKEVVPFLKVERKDDGDDFEGYTVNGGDGGDDEHLEAVWKEGKTPLKECTKDEEFSESDDEPLKKRTEAEDDRGKRKKKIKNEDRKKREKPAGVVTHPRVARRLRQLNVPQGQIEMYVLSWEEVEAERQKALQETSYTRHQWRCDRCALGFNHKFKLENHMKKHDPARGEAKCSACGIHCRDAHSLAAHRRRHRVRWRCCVCGVTWSRAAIAADHFARAHGASAPTHTCNICGHTEPTLGKLRNHLKNHAERPKCDLCDKTFRDKSSLRTHLFIHKGEKEYSCEHCGKQFLFKKAMQLHQMTHDAPAHLYCHQCDVTFKNKMTYYQHMKYNLKHIDPALLKYACATCGKKFTKAARLNEHNTAVHLKATPVKCTMPECTFACSSRTVLRTHVRMVHRRVRDRKDHVCHICGKAYKTKTSLEGHMRAHSGERPFACGSCSSTFAYEAALYNHRKLVHLKAKLKKTADPPSTSPQTGRDAPAFPAPAVDTFPPLVGSIKVTNLYCNQPL